jgi:RHS repeat-associated protein
MSRSYRHVLLPFSGRRAVVARSRWAAPLVVVALVSTLVQGLTVAVAPHGLRALASAATGSGGEFVSVQGRVLDTQHGTGGYSTPMSANAWRSVQVDGQVGVPSSGVSAVAVNFTVVTPAAAGGLYADKDEATPNKTISYLYYTAGPTQSNTAVLAVGADGKIQVQTSTSVDLYVDVQGYYTAGNPAAGGYVPITPSRLVDTRLGTGLPKAQLTAGSTTLVQASGNAGVPADASALAVNFTIINQSGAGWFEPYAADQTTRPLGSLNYAADTDSIGAQFGLSQTGSPAGAFKLFNQTSKIDLVVDVVGYYTPSTTTGAFTPATARVYDSRTIGHTQIAGHGTATVQVAGAKGVPLAGSGIAAVTTNIAVIDSGTNDYWLRVWGHGNTEPATSSLNYSAPGTSSGMVTTALGTDGAISIRNIGPDPIDFIVDVEGWYTDSGTAVARGQDRTQQSITLQAGTAGGGPWVSYQYRIGTTASFANVPLANVKDGSGNAPTAWPVQSSGGTFTPYTWNIRDTLAAIPANNGTAPDSLIQVQACYGTSSTDPNPVCGMPSNIQFAQSAFGDGFATQQLGPGLLALLTGDYQLAATDAAAGTSLGSLTIGRTLTTLAPADAGGPVMQQRSDASGVFGPGWTADLAGPDAGDANLTVTDKTSYLLFTAADGGVASYQATSPTSTYPVNFAAVGDTAGDGTTVTKTNATTITMADPDGTITTWTKTGTSWRVAAVTQPGSNTTSSYSYNTAGLVTRILAPVPVGVTCANPDTTPGCRSLVLSYQTITVSGVSVTRLQTVSLSLPQTAGTANTIPVTAYDYDVNGWLADAYDPRITPALKTAYTYTAAGRLATLTPPGQAAWSLGYDSTGRLTTLSRPDPSGGTAKQTVAYGVPLSGDGLPDLTAHTTGTWNQTSDLPVTGTGIFPASHQPGTSTTSGDWPYAAITYLDVNGRQVNTAGYGAGDWQIDTTQHDANGNDVWELAAGNRAQALTPTSATDPYIAGLASNVTRADLLASTTVYNPLDASLVTDTYGPTHPVTLDDGTTIDARSHVATSYDEGAPNSDVDPITGAAYSLPTTVVSDPYNVATSADAGYPDAQTTHTGYDPISSGDPSGWTLHQPTSSAAQMGASPSTSNDLTTYTRYNTAGQTIETRLPGDANGTGPRTTDTTYYTAAGSGSCGGNPATAGLVCSTAPAAQPATGNPLPVTSSSYNLYGQQLTKTETYGTGSSQVVRTGSNSFDPAGRLATSAVTVTPANAGGTPLPAVSYSYDPDTGLPTTTSTGSGATAHTLTTGYDTLGRAASYTDATGNTTHITYTIDGQVATVDDGKGTTSYTYGSANEHRGLITSEDIGVPGAPSSFTASYDPAGQLSAETYPTGLVATRDYDNAGNPTALTYAKDDTTWMRFTATIGNQDRTVAQTSPQSAQTFGYDQDGRLTTVHDTYQGACTTRVYGFDAASNRTKLDSYPAAADGSCTNTNTATTATSSYDQADRITNTGYSYDQLGRTLTVPAADAQGTAGHAGDTGALTLGYYANDMIATQNQGSAAISFTLDPLQNRIATETDGTATTTNHYTGTGDSPAWTSTSSTTWTRNLLGPNGDLAATTDQDGSTVLQLCNLHGDIVATAEDTPAATSIANYIETTEYGAPRTPASANPTYGWLGTKQRSSNDLGGLALMGVRPYNPAIGRFLSVDPIPGGNPNAYTYPVDPIRGLDLDGRCGFWGHNTCWHHWRGMVQGAAVVGGAFGAGLCVASVWCGIAVGAAAGAGAYAAGNAGTRNWSWAGFGWATAWGAAAGRVSKYASRYRYRGIHGGF